MLSPCRAAQPETSQRTMPIYAYKCESCGFAKDILRKMSDAPLTDCPQCGAASFKKQLTSAGFQLKGSGWYVTDFRSGNNGAAAAKPADGEPAKAAGPDAKPEAAGATAAAALPPAASAPAATPAKPSSAKGASSDASSKSS